MALRILVIEDSQDSMDLLVYLLSAFNCEIFTAKDGREGVMIAEAEKPDLILCDIQMPTMNGYEVAEYIKSNSELAHIPLIAVTALAMVGDRQKAINAGFDNYISKPILPDQFIEEIKKYLDEEFQGNDITTALATAMEEKSEPQGETILVVDDRSINRELATAILESSNHKVITSHCMQDAMEKLQVIKPDMIISDVCMMDGTGYDFIRKVKSDPVLRSIPFIFITSTMTTLDEREKGLALGAASYLFRPIEPHILLDEVRNCLNRQMAGN